MLDQLASAFRITLVLTILTGLVYPGVVTGIAQAVFPRQSHGSLVSAGGKVVGSSLLGQTFTKPEYFHSRPSSAGAGYDAANSGGSNLGPTSAKLINGVTSKDDKGKETVAFDGIKDRLVHYCIENVLPYESSVPLDRFMDAGGTLDDVKLIDAFNDDKAPLVFTPKTPIPADAVTASASGLDPHISPANAAMQVARVAKARGASEDAVRVLVEQSTEQAWLGFIGEPRVNVLELNLALDQQWPRR